MQHFLIINFDICNSVACTNTRLKYFRPSWIFTNHRLSIFMLLLLTFLCWAYTPALFNSAHFPVLNQALCQYQSAHWWPCTGETISSQRATQHTKVLSMTTLVSTGPSYWQLAHCLPCLWSGLVSLCLDSSITDLNAASSTELWKWGGQARWKVIICLSML